MRAQSLKVVTSSAKTTGTDEWTTPDDLLDCITDAYGPIDTDPCTNDDNPCDAVYFYTAAKDGRNAPFRGLTYCNPPYSKMLDWAIKIRNEASEFCTIVTLCPARVDTRWWRILCAEADGVVFLGKRVVFGDAQHGAPFPSAIVVHNLSVKRLVAELGAYKPWWTVPNFGEVS